MKYIYALQEPITLQTRYIGQTKNPKERLKGHLRKSYNPKQYCQCWIKGLLEKNQKPVMKILLIVEEFEWEYYEREVIKLYDNLTNLTEGGQSVWWSKLSQEEKEKFRAKMKFVNSNTNRISKEGRQRMREAAIKTHTGRKCTEEHKRRMSEKMTGENNHRFGKEVSKETRIKLSLANRGKKQSEKAKQLLLERNEKRKTKVTQLDKERNTIQTFDSIAEAAKETGLERSNITACCKGRLNKTGGFGWRYED